MSTPILHKKGLFVTLVLGAIITSLMSTVMVAALPAIMTSLKVPASQAQLLTSVYSLVSGIVIIATAVLMKWIPTKSLFFSSMGIFSFGILLCAVAPNFGILLLGRAIQGIGYGVLISMTQVVILSIVPAEKRGFAMGIYALAVVFAPVVGPIAAGFIIDHASWQLIFWLVLVLCLIDLVMGSKFMSDVLPTSPQKIDWPSMALASIGFTSLVLAAGNMGDSAFLTLQVSGLFAIGVLTLVAFSVRQLHMEIPLINLRVFKHQKFTITVIVSVILYAIMNAMTAIMPILIQTIMGKSATTFGIAVAPCALCLAALSPLTGKWYDKIGLKRLAIIGSIIVTISNAAILFIDKDIAIPILMLLLALLGVGLSGMQMNIVTYGMDELQGDEKTDGTALLSSLRTMGTAFGTAAFVAILSMGVTNNHYQMVDVHRSYLWMTILSVVVLLISIFFIHSTKDKQVQN